MKGTVVFRNDNRLVVRLENGNLLAHDLNEHCFAVGDEVQTIHDDPKAFYAPATNGHCYLTVDYHGREGETDVSESGFVVDPTMETLTKELTLIDRAYQFGMVQVKEEIEAFVEFLRHEKLRNVMEIGSEAGGTFFLWCRLASMGGLKISLDLPTGSSGSGNYAQPEALDRRSIRFRSFAPRVKVITGDSHERETRYQVLRTLDGEELDFLFIDGDHSYEGVKQDFEDYQGLVKPGGLIGFHDIKDSEYHRTRSCYVSQWWEELAPRFDSEKVWEFRNEGEVWGGIGVIRL